MMKRLALIVVCLVHSQSAVSEVPIDSIPNVATLPAEYPDTWLFALDANFDALIAGKVIIVDVAAETQEYKGAVGAAQFATFMESSTRSELYVGETFYSRGTVGERTDVVTIYDKSSLEKTGEVVLPGAKRGQFVTNNFAMQLVDDDRFLLVFNFTPASSVSIINIETREWLNEIPIPGCSLIYPTGERGFSSLCGDGSMISIQFDEQGKQTSKHHIEPFFSVDDDPVFDKPTYIGKTAYFVSYKARIYPVDMAQAKPKPLAVWSLASDDERADNWRPSGWQVITSDNEDELYFIMHPDGFDGSHKSGGGHIWVANTESKQVVRKFQTVDAAFSLAFVGGDSPMLAVTNVNMWLDVYSLDGKCIRSLSLGNSAMPFSLQSKR
jgi:methylamine dehydrogenase heavy chain